jgi:transposase-like protein
MDPLAPVIKPELLDELLKLTKDPKVLFGAQGVLQRLKGALMDRILEAELTEHLGYESGAAEGRGSGNSRNGHTQKTVTTESGPVDIRVPRDRAGTFEPQLVPKHARRLEGFDEHVLSLYGRGMPMREIQEHLRQLYGTEISPDLITRVTDAVLEHAREWQARPLEPVYPVLYIDALYTNVRDGGAVTKKAIYVALGIAISGQRDVLGLWIEPSEGARTWLTILTELKNRGLQDVLFVCCDGLSGLPQAIGAVFPKATVQTCIVHLIRASLRYVHDKDPRAEGTIYTCIRQLRFTPPPLVDRVPLGSRRRAGAGGANRIGQGGRRFKARRPWRWRGESLQGCLESAGSTYGRL